MKVEENFTPILKEDIKITFCCISIFNNIVRVNFIKNRLRSFKII